MKNFDGTLKLHDQDFIGWISRRSKTNMNTHYEHHPYPDHKSTVHLFAINYFLKKTDGFAAINLIYAPFFVLIANNPACSHHLVMAKETDFLIETRATLLARLRDISDHKSWEEFFDIYSHLICGVALKQGLTRIEAEDVLQETMLTVAKQMPSFRYDPNLGSFKSWLMTTARWRIVDQFRKRQRHVQEGSPISADGESSEDLLAKLASNCSELEKIWDDEWKNNLMEAASGRARRRMNPKKFQIFDLCVNKGRSAEHVAQLLAISVNQVYLAKHRVAEAIKQEIERLQNEII